VENLVIRLNFTLVSRKIKKSLALRGFFYQIPIFLPAFVATVLFLKQRCFLEKYGPDPATSPYNTKSK